MRATEGERRSAQQRINAVVQDGKVSAVLNRRFSPRPDAQQPCSSRCFNNASRARSALIRARSTLSFRTRYCDSGIVAIASDSIEARLEEYSSAWSTSSVNRTRSAQNWWLFVGNDNRRRMFRTSAASLGAHFASPGKPGCDALPHANRGRDPSGESEPCCRSRRGHPCVLSCSR